MRQTLREQRFERRSCDGKRRFKTEEEAASELAAIRRSALSQNYDAHVRPYRCDYCTCWHLGHPSEVVTPRDRASAETSPDEHGEPAACGSTEAMREALRRAGLLDG